METGWNPGLWVGVLDRNRTTVLGPVPIIVGTVQNVSNGTLKGSSGYPGQERAFRQELLGKKNCAESGAAASESLASSQEEECWIDPDPRGKASRNRASRCASRTARPSRKSNVNVPLPAGNSQRGRQRGSGR